MKTRNPNIDPEAPASVVIGKWKSLYKFCKDTGYSPSTVYRWLESGFINGKYQAPIIAKGEAATPKIKVKAADFVDQRKVTVSA